MSINHFDVIASQYENSLPAHINQHYLLKRVQFIKSILQEGIILDVGCGTGTVTQMLACSGFRSFGVDQSVEMLRIAESKRKGYQAQATAQALPFTNERFNLVITIATLHHLADHDLIDHAIDEMLRVVLPGGYLLIWDHNPRNLYWKLLMKRVPQDCGEERLISHKEILAILAKHQDLIKTINVLNLGFVPDFVPLSLLPQAIKLEAFLEKIPLIKKISAHNVILVKKG